MIDCCQSHDDSLQMPITLTSYHEQLKILNIYSLQRWREQYAIIYICKIAIQLLPKPGLEIYYNPRAKVKVTPKQCITSVGKILIGYVHYIFARSLCMSKRQHLWNKEKCFLFHFESYFHSWDNQILTFQVFKHQGVIQCLSMEHKTHFTE